MYISEIRITNFRCFLDETALQFNDGINVIIGHNNSGKSNLLKALSLLFNPNESKKLTVDDFNKKITEAQLRTAPPKIVIAATLSESKTENLYSDDLVIVSTWLTKLEKPYEAKLSYEFYLPESDHAEYLATIAKVDLGKSDECWKVIKEDFIRKYTHKLFVGDPTYRTIADQGILQYFDYQFLDAIRDVQRDLFTGKNALLKEVLEFFIDYEIKNHPTKTKEVKAQELQNNKKEFARKAKELIENLHLRMSKGKDEMLKYAENTGATFGNAKPSFDGDITDSEMYSALKLIVEHETGIRIPATHNGLGYNNLIYISLLLAKMQKDSAGNYLGSNAKVFPMLVIEEPEAHLHPAMQYKFLKFLKTNRQTQVKQIFITSHSPNITSAVDLDEIIVMHADAANSIKVAYPGRVFADTPEDKISKDYVARFLDVTKSDMLFSKSVILVEGIAEQLLLPEFSACLNKRLDDGHVAVINIGGRYFNHFLKLFSPSNAYAINKKIACITDLDPMRREKADGHQYEVCYPYELDKDTVQYEYQRSSNEIIAQYSNPPVASNIKAFAQEPGKGKTFEYDLALSNPDNPLILINDMTNKDELERLIQAYKDNKSLDAMLALLRSNNKENERIKASLVDADQASWSEQEKKKHLIASRYLSSVDKGAHAFSLAVNFKQRNPTTNAPLLNVPAYISNAIDWVL